MNHDSHTSSASTIIHIVLAAGIALAYVAVPFTALRRLPLLPITRISGTGLFITCAITHLAMVSGLKRDNPWMLLSDLVQLVSVVTFIVSLNRQVAWALKRRGERDRIT